MTITKLLGIKYPVFQGAMAQIARYELVSAVSNAGALGILASVKKFSNVKNLQINLLGLTLCL